MKRRFPILLKVIILGIGVSILTAGTSIVLSYFNQNKRGKEALIDNIDYTLDEAEYIFQTDNQNQDYVENLKTIRKYIEPIFDNDKDKKTLDDFDTFKEFADYYIAKYPWIYPNQGGIGLSYDQSKFNLAYYSVLNLLNNFQMSSGSVSAILSFIIDGNSNEDVTNKTDTMVIMSDSRMDNTGERGINSFYFVPGSFYQINDSDYYFSGGSERHDNLKVYGRLTRYLDIYDLLEDKTVSNNVIATICIEYNLDKIEADTLKTLNDELLILGGSSLTLIIIYTVFSYLLFVRNINLLSRSSSEIRRRLINKDMNEVVEIPVKSNDEMKVLADSLVEMEKSIINYVNIIHQEMEEKERTNAELSVASKIQLDSLPKKEFEDKNVSLRAYIKTAKEVGGDFYDYFYLDNNRLALIIADVSGKGVPASLFMMKGKELIKSSLVSHSSLSEAIKNANNLLSRNNKELLFITSFIGIIDFDKNEIKYINAGQEKPYIISNNRVIKLDGESNVVLGVEEGFSFKEETHSFNKGDYIFMFTDGLNESINKEFEEFGYQRIEDNLVNVKNEPLNEIIENINNSLNEFVSSEEQFDDVTLLFVKYKNDELSLHYEKKDYEIITDIVDSFNEYFSFLSDGIKSSAGIIIDEMVNNLISYEKREDLVIDVFFRYHKNDLTIRIISNGNDYNPFANHKEKYLEDFHPEIKEGGLGLSIVKVLSKSYSYQYVDSKSIIEFVIEEKEL